MALSRDDDPVPALEELFDLPLKLELMPAGHEDKLEALRSEAKSVQEWEPVYDKAVSIGEGIVDAYDAALEDAKRRAGQAKAADETKRKAREALKDAERIVGEAVGRRAAVDGKLKRTLGEWKDRALRQEEQIHDQCSASIFEDIEIEEEDRDGVLMLSVNAEWWSKVRAYVEDCCRSWSGKVCDTIDDTYATTIREGLTSLEAGAPPAPPRDEPLTVDLRMDASLPEDKADVPGTGMALLQFLRSNVLAVGIFGTVIAVVFAMLGRIGGGSGRLGGSTMMMRGGLILALLPILLVVGVQAARRQRARLREKALDRHKKAVHTALSKNLSKALERHRKRLENWVEARADAHKAEVQTWFETKVAPSFEKESDADANSAPEVDRLALRTERNKVRPILVKLKKRLRKLRDA